MKYFTWITLAMLCSVSTTYAEPSLEHFQYSVRIPATSKSCAEEAQALAGRISSAQADAKNIVGRCLATTSFVDNKETFNLYSLVVDYDANSSQIARTELQIDAVGVDPFSTILYPSFRSCLEDLENQQNLYRQAMALTPIAAYCADKNLPGFGFTLTIEAIGQPKAALYSFVDRAYDHAKNDSNWHAAILDTFKAAEANLPAPGGATVAKFGAAYILYYANEAVSLNSEPLVQTYTADECSSQMNAAQAMLANDGAKHSYVACHSIDYGRFSLDAIVDTYEGLYSDAGIDSQVYYSFAECLANRELILEKAAANGVAQPLGVFCSTGLENQRYQIEIFSR